MNHLADCPVFSSRALVPCLHAERVRGIREDVDGAIRKESEEGTLNFKLGQPVVSYIGNHE